MLVVSAPQDAVLSKDVHTLLITAVTAASNLTYINSKALSDACTQLTPLFQVLSVAKLNPVVSEIFFIYLPSQNEVSFKWQRAHGMHHM